MAIVPGKSCGVYRILCVPTGKFYVGSSQNIPRRWQLHREKLITGKQDNPHLQRAWNRYGPDAFQWEILETTTPDRLLEREQFYLDTLRPCDHTIGFNIAPQAGAPMRGRKASEETRQRMSAAQTGKTQSEKTRKKLSDARKGVPQPQLNTPEARAKKAAAARNRKHTNETRQKMAATRRQFYADLRKRKQGGYPMIQLELDLD
jgi:group I intron endonuclease